MDDYKEHIIKQLEGYPALTVVKIYREIQDMGYTGKYTILPGITDSFPGYAVHIAHNRYSVPYRYAGRSATVRIEDSTISILVDNKQICEHELLFGSNRVSENKEHFKGLLSEIKKQNNTSAKTPCTILRFGDPVVEHRPIASYEKFSEEC